MPQTFLHLAPFFHRGTCHFVSPASCSCDIDVLMAFASEEGSVCRAEHVGSLDRSYGFSWGGQVADDLWGLDLLAEESTIWILPERWCKGGLGCYTPGWPWESAGTFRGGESGGSNNAHCTVILRDFLCNSAWSCDPYGSVWTFVTKSNKTDQGSPNWGFLDFLCFRC